MADRDDRIISSRAAPPVGAYPHARHAGDFLFLSGIGPRRAGTDEIPGVRRDEGGQIVSHDIETQTRAVIDNLKFILEDCGSSLERIVDVTVFLTHMSEDFTTFNRVYAEYFSTIQPTRTTIGVVALPTPIAIELKVIAQK
ncbi:MAG: Rid family hydrolase [Acidobacteriota bacterium]